MKLRRNSLVKTAYVRSTKIRQSARGVKRLYILGEPLTVRQAVKTCHGCGREFVVPKCWVARHHSCSVECRDKVYAERATKLVASRTRVCGVCGSKFVVKKSQIDAGQGNHCSVRCAWRAGAYKAVSSPEAIFKRVNTCRERLGQGLIVRKRGPEHPLWNGGSIAARRRRQDKAVIYNKEYRRQNPEKVREYASTRKGRKLSCLPRGTIPRLFKLQKKRCAVCRCKLGSNYHVDHIVPLMLGGEHVPSNLQILCPTCNVRKWAKDPVQFMQERGFLI